MHMYMDMYMEEWEAGRPGQLRFFPGGEVSDEKVESCIVYRI